MHLPKYGTNQLPKAGFDWIALRVIFQGRKVIHFSLFSNFDTYCLFIQNLFSNFFSILAWSFPRMVTMNLWRDRFDWITHCQGQKGQVWLIFTYFAILISSIEVLLKVIFKVRQVKFGPFVIYLCQYLRNDACCDQCLYEAHIESHIWSFRCPCDLWPWITFKGQIKVTDLSSGCVS